MSLASLPGDEISLETIRAAHERIASHVRRTPVLESETLNSACDAQLFFKCENFQQVGAFKARGATNAVMALSAEQLRAGVVTHSSGNHGAALARAAQLRGVPARIVMPKNSAAAKLDAVRRFGGLVLSCEPGLTAREAMAAQVVAQTGAAFVHPYDDPQVICGQGTIALELLEQQPELEWIVCPIGGGGLISGVAVAAKALRPGIRIIGVEPAGADDAYRSFTSGVLVRCERPSTLADGLRGSLSARTFALVRQHVDAIVTVSEAALIASMRAIWEHLKIVVEPSSAVALAALRERRIACGGARVGVVLTGGNVDLDTLPWQSAAATAG